MLSRKNLIYLVFSLIILFSVVLSIINFTKNSKNDIFVADTQKIFNEFKMTKETKKTGDVIINKMKYRLDSLYKALNNSKSAIDKSQIVKQIVQNSPQVEDFISNNLLNYSQYAKLIRPEIEKTLCKNVELGSIVTALGRLKSHIKTHRNVKFKVLDIAIKYPITLFAIPNTNAETLIYNQIQLELPVSRNNFVNFIRGNHEAILCINSAYSQLVLSKLKTNYTVQSDLSAISLRFLEDQLLENTGIYYTILKSLAWSNIPFVEIISTYTELTLIVKNSYSQQVLECLSVFLKK